MTVIKVKLQYTIAFLWMLYAANTNRLETKLIQQDSPEKQSSASKTMPLTGMLLNNSVTLLHGL